MDGSTARGLTMLAGSVIGAAAVNPLHAQNKASAAATSMAILPDWMHPSLAARVSIA